MVKSKGYTREDILQRLEPLPYGCLANAVREGDGWCISISAVYGGYVWFEQEYLPDTMQYFVSAIRDKLMTRHWRRARDLLRDQPHEVGGLYWLLFPYSKMEQLNHAAF